MVLISLIVQLFLLFAGTCRRGRMIGGLLRLTLWLAFLGADTVAVFGIGLFSRYEEKYKLRSTLGGSSGDHHTLTVPFLWVPFLLVHLGGQDTISAFSIEDNNLWLRHLLNLVIQVILALYIFWKSIDVLDAQLLAMAVPMFVCGIIKYVERTWALQRGSRDSLGSRHRRRKQERNHDELLPPVQDYTSASAAVDHVVARYALNSVLRGRELLVGRTLFQLGTKIQNEIVDDFAELGGNLGKLKIVMMELDMMYDFLYTKAMVLRCRTGRVLRCVALISLVLAFALFLQANYDDGPQHANVAITCTLFVGAIFMELYSISMAIASPWTRAWSKEGTFLYWLSNSLHNAAATMQGKTPKQGYLSSRSMGHFNLTDYSLSEKCKPNIISKVITALNLDKHWRNLWYIESVDDNGMLDYMAGFFQDKQSSRPSGRREGSSQQLELGRELNYLLTLPFEHALFRLHIFTDLHLSKAINLQGLGDDESILTTKLMAECRKLSNYMMYLMAVNPSMLPVSSAAQDLEPFFAQWVRDNHSGTMSRTEILEKYATEKLANSGGTFSSTSPFLQEHPSVASLKEVKEVWARLLIYAAGKCPMELHARQLGNGVELLTVIGWLMMHHGLGDVGIREHNLLSSDDPHVPIPGSMVSVDQSSLTRRTERPLYAFEFLQLDQDDHQASVPPTSSLLRLASSQQLPRSVVRAWAPHNDIVEDKLLCRCPPQHPQFAPQNPNAFPSSSEIKEADQSSETLHGLDIPTLSPQYQPNTHETDVASDSELYWSASEIELPNLSSEIHQLDLPQQFASQPITTVETDVASELEQKQAEGAVLQIERADMALEISCMMATAVST